MNKKTDKPPVTPNSGLREIYENAKKGKTVITPATKSQPPTVPFKLPATPLPTKGKKAPKAKKVHPPPTLEAPKTTTPAKKRKLEALNPDIGKSNDKTIAKLQWRLIAYGKNEVLGPFLKDRGHQLDHTKVRKLNTVAKLEAEIIDVEMSLNDCGNSALVDAGIRGSMEMLETAAQNFGGLRVKGTTEKCWDDKHWRFVLERVRLKHGLGIGNMDPAMELAFATFQAGAMCHLANSVKLTPATNLETPISLD